MDFKSLQKERKAMTSYRWWNPSRFYRCTFWFKVPYVSSTSPREKNSCYKSSFCYCLSFVPKRVKGRIRPYWLRVEEIGLWPFTWWGSYGSRFSTRKSKTLHILVLSRIKVSSLYSEFELYIQFKCTTLCVILKRTLNFVDPTTLFIKESGSLEGKIWWREVFDIQSCVIT